MTNQWWSLGTQITLGGNDLWRFGVLFGIIIAALGIGKIAHRLIISCAARWENKQHPVLAVFLRAVAKTVGFIGMAIGLKLGMDVLILTAPVAALAGTVTDILMVAALFWALYCLVDVVNFWMTRSASRGSPSGSCWASTPRPRTISTAAIRTTTAKTSTAMTTSTALPSPSVR